MNMCANIFLVLKYVSSSHVLKVKLSEVIRAEAETCFLEIMKINILMLLLFMIINNLVLTKVAIIQNIMICIGYKVTNIR